MPQNERTASVGPVFGIVVVVGVPGTATIALFSV